MRTRNYYARRPSPWPRRIASALAAVLLVVALWQLIGYGLQQLNTRTIHQELKESLATDPPPSAGAASALQPSSGAASAPPLITAAPTQAPTPTLPPWQKPPILARYQRLHERNSDLVGWLTIERLYRVDLPIVQRDQSYYLRRDFDGNSNVNGTAFLDSACRIWPRDDNLIIYAHNMKSGEMFGELHRLADAEYYMQAPMVWFDTIYEEGMYVPVAAVLCTVQDGPEYFPFYQRNFADAAAFDAYVAGAKAVSKLDTPFTAVCGDDLLTLVTCWDEKNEYRFVLILRRIRADENADALMAQWY